MLSIEELHIFLIGTTTFFPLPQTDTHTGLYTIASDVWQIRMADTEKPRILPPNLSGGKMIRSFLLRDDEPGSLLPSAGLNQWL